MCKFIEFRCVLEVLVAYPPVFLILSIYHGVYKTSEDLVTVIFAIQYTKHIADTE
jgi:hypothetical protein